MLGGFAAGALSGLFGVGGGVVMVPVLIAAGLSQHQSHATSLAAIVPIAAVGALLFALQGEIDWAIAGLLALGATAGAPAGARAMERIPQRSLRLLFGALMFAVATELLI